MRRVLATGFLVASLAVPDSTVCACSDRTEAPQHEHCSSGEAGHHSLHRGCDCACMSAQTQASAIARTAVSSKAALLVKHLVPVLTNARPPAFIPPQRWAALSPSPPLAPALVLRV